jgi:hypothetical protein
MTPEDSPNLPNLHLITDNSAPYADCSLEFSFWTVITLLSRETTYALGIGSKNSDSSVTET